MRSEDRERVQVEVSHRVVERCVDQARKGPDGMLQMVVNDTLYHERRRLERADPRSPRTKTELAFYKSVRRRVKDGSEENLRQVLDEVVRRFVSEVVGNFDDRVYRLSTTVVPTGLSLLLNTISPRRLLDFKGIGKGITDLLKIQGCVDHVRKLQDMGTLVVLPTHSSNLDSILLGYAIHLMGVPPLLYGAGLNLFSNPLLSFFMRNLGAYRVDRKKTAKLYKDVLKEYATCATEMGYHQLFFPGGTRSRNGAVEQHLKKGLLGTSVRAYVGNLVARKDRPNLYVVPCTLSYKLVLEAETLIGDHLKEMGKARYIIDDDEFSKPRRILNFLNGLVSLNDEIVLTVGEPLDVFGNRVDDQGRSLDPRGRVVDPATYVSRQGEPVFDDQRDMQYTNEVAEEVRKSYLNDNVLMTTNLVGRALFNLLRRSNPGLDLYRLLHTGGTSTSFTMTDVHAETDRLLKAVVALPNGPRLSQTLQAGDIQEIVADALSHFAIYHTRPAAVRRGDRVFHEERNLLLYYGNRLQGYDQRTLEGGV